MAAVPENILNDSPGESVLPTDGIAGFSQRVLRYFQDFIETDFRRQQAPRRRVQLKNDAGFSTGIPVRKYSALFEAIWKACREPASKQFQITVLKGRYTAPLSVTLRDLIEKQVAAIDAADFASIATFVQRFAQEHRVAGAKHADAFVEDVAMQFVDQVGQRIVAHLLSMLEQPFKQNAYSAVESVFDIEAELTEAITAPLVAQLPKALTTLIATAEMAPLTDLFNEFFAPDDVRRTLADYFQQFATADVFHELRDLDNTLRVAEGQSCYLYLCDVRFGTHTFPMFYVPLALSYDRDTTSYILKGDPHLFINKRALDWIGQELADASNRTFVSPVADRILRLEGADSFAAEATRRIKAMVPVLDVAARLDLADNRPRFAESASVRMSNALYLSVFDSADESISSDYETLIAAIQSESKEAAVMFENIVRGMILDEPRNAQPQIEAAWDDVPTVDRLIADSPIPVNEEQRKIQIALRTPDCRYIVVQGPPGTGKSHTISAIAFDAILSGRNILILSDKVEALDVVEDKLAATLAKVRHAEDFPNPILRLGKTSTYPKLIAASNLERIKEQDKAQRASGDRLDKETAAVHGALRANVAATISAYSGVRIADIEAMSRLEAELEPLSQEALLRCQEPMAPGQLQDMTRLLGDCPPEFLREVAVSVAGDALSAPEFLAKARQLQLLGQVQATGPDRSALSLFTGLNGAHQAKLAGFIVDYQNARWPLFGNLFSRAKARSIDQRVGAELPCLNPLDLHKRLDDLKAVAATLSSLGLGAKELGLDNFQIGATYDMLAAGRAMPAAAAPVARFMDGFQAQFPGLWAEGDMPLTDKVLVARKYAEYAVQWAKVANTINSAPVFDYVEDKSQLESLHASRMSREIDRKFVNFVGENRALAKSIGEVIKAKKQFPTNEFGRFGQAFPCIIAGVREFAQYVPMKEGIFDIVVIDEASQVSLAQAFPALLRARRVVVFGDDKQFSNVKSQQASKERNATYLTDMDTYFRRNISDAADRIERLKQFDVKKSVLDFFKLIANAEIMLKKHFRGYQELISFSSKEFYGGNLQAIKVRSKPLTEVLRFHQIVHDGRSEKHRNANSMEAEFILAELRCMVDEQIDQSVGIITPFREQQEALSRLILNDSYADRFNSFLHLKIMTFDSCQGEERDLIIYSMVASPAHDGLNYIFPTNLSDETRDRIEDALKVQRLNVGFSRAKEGMLFVLSKPVAEFKGSAGAAIRHFYSQLEHRATPTGGPTESPMEAKVLQYVQQTPFYQNNIERVELQTQFPLGEYLKQLEPTYKHPAYRCDFLLTYTYGAAQVRVIIEYDGFAEHFRNRDKVTAYNYEQFYREEDIERQLIIEGYGYKFLRINRFNLGKDPVETLSKRLFQLVQQASREKRTNPVITQIREAAEDLSDKSAKVCSRCGNIREMRRFFDPSLKGGAGGYGRVCMLCKRNS